MEESGTRYINPFTDFGFKKIFGEEYNKDLLIDFLNSILNLMSPIVDVTYGSQEKLPPIAEDRKSIVDIYCESQNGEKFIVEMQKTKQLFFKDRSVLYVSFPIVQQAKKGKWNYELTPVYAIAVLDFVYKDEKDSSKYLHDVRYYDISENEIFYDKVRLLYLEMPKFKKKLNELRTNEDKWLYFLKNLPEMDEQPAELDGAVFEKAFEQAEIANYTKDEYNAYIASLDYYWCNYADMDTAKQEGREEERKIQEAKLKQLQENHQKELQEKDCVIQEKDAQLQESEQKHQEQLRQIALTLFNGGKSKEEVLSLTGITL